jgi:hypothetical protein
MYILTTQNLISSAKLLAKELNKIYKEETVGVVTSPPYNYLQVRWGTSMYPVLKDTNYNSPDSIRSVGNKLLFSMGMEKAKIPHVELVRGSKPDRFPVVVRTVLNRGGGIGMEVCENSEQFAPYKEYPWSYWYNFSTEVGVHLLGGIPRRIFKKVRVEGLEQEKFPRRNTNNGYTFSLIKQDKYPKLLQFCEEFYAAFPIQMGRADIGWDSDAKSWRIIEFNSAPDLTQNQNTLEMYAQFLAERI